MFPPQLNRGYTLAWQTGQIPAKQGVCLFPADYKDSPVGLLDPQEAGKKKHVSIDGRDCLLPSVGTACVNS